MNVLLWEMLLRIDTASWNNCIPLKYSLFVFALIVEKVANMEEGLNIEADG